MKDELEPCPLVTEYTKAMGLPDRTMEKLWAIRQHDPREGPININIGPLFREEFKLKNYQTQAVAHLMLMPRILIGDAVGLGKAQPLDSKVLTPNGWRTMGSLKVGDEVVDPDGGVGVVEGVYPQGVKPVYRLSTADGASTRCCEEHLWTVQTVEDKARGGKFRTLSLKEMLAIGLQGSPTGSRKQWKRNKYFLPMSSVDFCSGHAPVDPYLLGALIGDGGLTQKQVNFTSADAEIVAIVGKSLPDGCEMIKTQDTYGYRIKRSGNSGPNPLIDKLRKVGVMGKGALEKELPKGLDRWAASSRRSLLAGLLDTDGECSSAGQVYFHTSSQKLAQDVASLVRSLGGVAKVGNPRSKSYTHNGEKRVGSPSYYVGIQTPFNPFRLTRKATRWKKPLLSRAITEAIPDGECECQCIQVSTKRNLYITDDYIVTHNTITAIAGMAYHGWKNPDLKVLVITTKSVVRQFDNEIGRFSHLTHGVLLDKKQKNETPHQSRMRQVKHWLSPDGPQVLCAKYSSLVGRRAKVEGDFDEYGTPVGKDGKEVVSGEIRELMELLYPHKANLLVIFDECHKLKNQSASTRTSMMQIQQCSGRVWGLSASLIKNGADEIYSVMSALGIRPCGIPEAFRDKFCITRMIKMGFRHIPQLVGYRNMDLFKKIIRPWVYGRSQRQAGEDLPRLTTRFLELDLDEKQTKLLTRDIPSGNFKLPPGIKKVAGQVSLVERDPENQMTMLSVFQLVANHPCLLEGSNPDKIKDKNLSPKEEALFDLLDGDLRGEKVIVFTKFRSWIDRLEWLITEGGHGGGKFLRITGAEDEEEREAAKQAFQTDESQNLIVINTAAVEGVNLQQAAHMVCLDLPWSFGDLIQLVGRMLRLASPHSACTLHILVAKGTVDEYVITTLLSKKGVFEAILGESHSAGLLEAEAKEIDLDSGLDRDMTDDEFARLLKAHAKDIAMSTYLKGEKLQEAEEQAGEYIPAYEKKKRKEKEPPKSRSQALKEAFSME